ncbi:hypothetical protein FRB94_001960 [Tulasnella sp. JGI-2019a]|nr:hypothetical protein FRB94_001960 [Tulasnella sp. JGI-2019a]
MSPQTTRRCEPCAMTILGGASGWLSHEIGEQHQRLIAAAGPGTAQPIVPTSPPSFFCDACNSKFKSQFAWDSHTSAPSHHDKIRRLALRAMVMKAQGDKFGVIIAGATGVDLGIIPVDHWARNKSLVIKASSKALRLASMNFSTTMFSLASGYTLPISLNLGQPFVLSIDFNARKQLGLRGHFNDRAELRFENTTLRQSFTIVRRVKAISGSKADYELRKGKARFERPQKRRPRSNGRLVAGLGRSIRSSLPYVGHLPEYPLNEAVIVLDQEEQSVPNIRKILPRDLTAETYARHWHTLLYVEEEQMLRDIKAYDMIDTTLIPMGNLF